MTDQTLTGARARIAPAGLIFLAITSVGWGFNWPVTKYLLSELPPLTLRGATGVIGATLLALFAAMRGQSLKVPAEIWPRLILAGLLNVAFLGRTQQWQIREKPAGYIGSFLVGVTFAIGWTPCVGPILGAILSLAGTAETVQRGVGLLMAYSAGLGVPFLVSAFALGAFLRWFKRYRPYIPVVERGAGVLLIAVGVLVLFNWYVILNSWAISLTPEWLLKRL